ncbi:uncharacterized protein LOC129220058 [Uloborus diversus]|uniref:uncharacterized protein LOC129220058 n=1 Tax=Uloborus diversus TaxID=327109 RepID=UPI002409982A|nr:uncharacterized protein LOC129220058 [Uloborus diversus]
MLAQDAYLRSVRDVHLNSTLSPSDLPHPSKRVPISLVDFNATNLNNYDFVCFTDGSKINERVGLAFVLYQHEIEFSIHQFRISDNCSVFQAELLCLNLAVKHVSNFLGAKVLICSDSLSSLFSLLNVRSFEKLIVEVQSIISNINSHDICVDFTHVRGHSGIRGNERADALAKEATRLPFSLDVANHPSFWKLFYSKKATKNWNSEYLSSNKGKWTKRFLPTIFFRLKRQHLKTDFFVTLFLTGHGNFKEYCINLIFLLVTCVIVDRILKIQNTCCFVAIVLTPREKFLCGS